MLARLPHAESIQNVGPEMESSASMPAPLQESIQEVEAESEASQTCKLTLSGRGSHFGWLALDEVPPVHNCCGSIKEFAQRFQARCHSSARSLKAAAKEAEPRTDSINLYVYSLTLSYSNK